MKVTTDSGHTINLDAYVHAPSDYRVVVTVVARTWTDVLAMYGVGRMGLSVGQPLTLALLVFSAFEPSLTHTLAQPNETATDAGLWLESEVITEDYRHSVNDARSTLTEMHRLISRSAVPMAAADADQRLAAKRWQSQSDFLTQFQLLEPAAADQLGHLLLHRAHARHQRVSVRSTGDLHGGTDARHGRRRRGNSVRPF